MNRLICSVFGVALLAWTVPVSAQGDKMTVKEIMGRVNKGPAAVFPTVRKNLNADSPDWVELQKQAKEIAALTETMMKKDPPRGEKASWEKFCKDYAAEAKALAEAAQKKDKNAMIGVHTKITKACTACHAAHRPQ